MAECEQELLSVLEVRWEMRHVTIVFRTQVCDASEWTGACSGPTPGESIEHQTKQTPEEPHPSASARRQLLRQHT